MSLFPSLENFEPTRQSLHLYAQAMGVVPRAHAAAHPQWWHISLRVGPHGLRTTVIALPDGGKLWLEMDLRNHMLRVQTAVCGTQAISLQDGLTGTEMGDWGVNGRCPTWPHRRGSTG